MGSSQEFIFKWKIRNFLGDFYKCGEAIDSPIFEIKNFGGSKWRLRLYPNGTDETQVGVLGVYLYKKQNDIYSEETSLAFELELIDEGGEIYGKAKTNNYTYKINEHFGWERFIHTKKVSSKLKKWPKNVLTVQCHMFNNSKHKCSPDFEVHSEIPVNQILFLWKVKIMDISSKPVKKELVFTETSLYEISLNMLDNEVKINVSQKEETISPTFVECKLSLVNSNGDVLKSRTFTHLFETNDRSDIWELPAFITKAEVDSNHDCSGIGSFYLFCETAASNGIKPVITSSEYGTTKAEGNSTVSRDFKVMLYNNIYTDIKLRVENEEMQAHKCILASRSPVFSAMFDQNMIESQTGVINIPDFEANTTKLFLEFLYTDTVDNFNYESAKKLFVIADKYQVPSLVEKCAEFLESTLSLENVTDIISVADMISHNSLKKAAINFIAMNSIFIFNSDEWRYFIQENVRLAGEIISNITSNFKLVPITTKPI